MAIVIVFSSRSVRFRLISHLYLIGLPLQKSPLSDTHLLLSSTSSCAAKYLFMSCPDRLPICWTPFAFWTSVKVEFRHSIMMEFALTPPVLLPSFCRKWAGRNMEYNVCIAEMDCKVFSSPSEESSPSEPLYSELVSSVSNLTGPNDDWPLFPLRFSLRSWLFGARHWYLGRADSGTNKTVPALGFCFFSCSKIETKPKYSQKGEFSVF